MTRIQRGQPPGDDKHREIRELKEAFKRVKLEIKTLSRENNDLKAENEATILKLAQTEQLLGDTTVPTVFNQLQVI